MKWFRRKEEVFPSRVVLEDQVKHALVRLGEYYGRRAAWEAADIYGAVLADPESDIAVTVDIMHMERTL